MPTQQELEALFSQSSPSGETEDLAVLFEQSSPAGAQPEALEGEAPAAPFQEIDGQLVETPVNIEQQDPTIAQQVVGAGETALALGTAATGGAIGNIAGALTGVIEQARAGKFGTPEGARLIEEKANEFMQALTFAPRTETGQEMTQDVTQALEPLTALTPATAEIGAATQALRTSVPKRAKPKAVEEPQPIKDITVDEVSDLATQVSKGSKKAKQKLAEEVKINPEAVDAADRLGIDLPSDILGDSKLLKQTTGLVRSQIGEESARFAEIIDNAVIMSDEALDGLGRTDIATTSGKILDDIDTSIKTLAKESENIYKDVSSKIPKNTQVQLVNSLDTISQAIDDLGGKKQLTREEKSLANLIDSNNVTYEALQRERRQIGQALGALPTGKYANSDKALLSKLYTSLKRDQLDNIESILGKESRDKLHLADRAFQKKIALEKRVADNFGKEGEGSISSLLTRSMTQGSKGDITALNKALKVVPRNLQKEAVISALSDSVGSKRGIDFGDFDFNNYTKLYKGLRKNAPVYNKIIKTIGEDKHQLLKDLFTISSRVTEAKSNIITTGKANQAILNKFQDEALLQKMIKTVVEKGVQKATLGGIQPSIEGLFKSSKDKLKVFGELIRSNEFKDLAVEAINEVPGKNTVKKLANSQKFKNFLNKTGQQIKNPEAWIYESLILEKEGE